MGVLRSAQTPADLPVQAVLFAGPCRRSPGASSRASGNRFARVGAAKLPPERFRTKQADGASARPSGDLLGAELPSGGDAPATSHGRRTTAWEADIMNNVRFRFTGFRLRHPAMRTVLQWLNSNTPGGIYP